MKAIINKKIYNTEKAVLVAEYWNGCSINDFGYIREELYKTANGNWFLFGRGGANTKYSESCGNNMRCGSEDIIPLDKEAVIEWLSNHNPEIVEEYFGNDIEEA